ncbi:MAG TPA: hypothetical protein VJL89_05465 [Thermodesulfovibrionia bacterium]|nr:hypothetical protein [Thermodesulfovibrionia bacterium]
MLIRNKKTFTLGIVMTVTFLGVLALIFSPVFNGQNGLHFADDLFNKLSKGSSYYIEKVKKSNEAMLGKSVDVEIPVEKAEDGKRTAELFRKAGAVVEEKDKALVIKGDLGKVLAVAIQDADEMYHNRGETLKNAYGYDEKAVLKDWWNAFSQMDKALKRDKKVDMASVVYSVNQKAIEPAYNFYKIEGQKVSEKAVIMTALLIFYVIYTMWWGFALFYIFDGIGLSMKKSKVKKEV